MNSNKLIHYEITSKKNDHVLRLFIACSPIIDEVLIDTAAVLGVNFASQK